jgi:TPR repeat protein/V8-like Glu-specific endopeptidase
MKTLLTSLCLTIAVLLGSVGESWSADSQKSITAYESGDFATALREWTPLAEQGLSNAQYNLGVMYENGKGVPQDYKTAVKWYRHAAEQGVARAQYNLGVMYENGKGVPQDYKTAVKWYRHAAEQGGARAQYNLGVMYEKGQGVPQDYKTAVKWYRLAAKQGLANAQHNLGVMYDKAQGVPQDYKTAVKWYRLAAKQGLSNAQYKLSIRQRHVPLWQHKIAKSESTPTVTAKNSPEPSSQVKKELDELRREFARLKKKNQSKPKQVAKKKPEPKSSTLGSGFFVSKSGHVITNQHIVNKCKKVTVGDNTEKQVAADIIETDRENDLALLKISSLKMASVETKLLIKKLEIRIVPLAPGGLMRAEDVELGEDVMVAGYPYGEIFSNSIKVTTAIVSASRGLGDDTGQFQIDATVQPDNSGGPIYDRNGNIVGVVIYQLNKRKFEKQSGSIPENVNFGIKASTVRQFLTSSGLPTKWSKRSRSMSTRDIAKIAKRQTVMVMCHQ